MFILGIAIIVGWLFMFFYYGQDVMPRNVSVGMVIGGLFSLGWGLLKGKNY
jgi:hypothetical protein